MNLATLNSNLSYYEIDLLNQKSVLNADQYGELQKDLEGLYAKGKITLICITWKCQEN
ncbi:hypothetical protein [Mycoplasma sp. NEAQ87857]|uniref:hypothetical protein n=1 Tax=Mycoplasma sp. NEAQ87857 TaxID=2683967 RepID=UPI00131D3A49|nr:hypothetical protein [Mycoplasma sp. NEAQ87857]